MYNNMTKEELLEEINKVKNATERGENTALRIGNILENLAELCLDKDDSCVYVCVSDTAVYLEEYDVYTNIYSVNDEENLERNRKAYNTIKKRVENKEGVHVFLSQLEGNLKVRELENDTSTEGNYVSGNYNTFILDVLIEDHHRESFKDNIDIIEANMGTIAFYIYSEMSESDYVLLLSTGHIINFYID